MKRKPKESLKACATRLGIKPKELKAMIEVRNDLAMETLEQIRSDKMHVLPDTGEPLFNMGVGAQQYKCGTVACIGGSMALKMGMGVSDASDYVWQVDDEEETPLNPLFYPPREYAYDAITPKQAVKAIDNFIATGKPKWGSLRLKKDKGSF